MTLKEILEIQGKIVVKEGADDKNFLASIEFVASLGDKLNTNGRLYPSAILKREAKRFGERISGQLNHPADGSSELDKISHVIEKLWFNDEKKALMASAKILKTSSGRDLLRLINSKVSLGASTRGFGNLVKKQDDDGNDYAEIKDDYRLGAVDIVSAPSFGSSVSITADNVRVFESVELVELEENEITISEEVELEIEKEREKMQESFKAVWEEQRGTDLDVEDLEDFESWLETRGVSNSELDELLKEDLEEWAEDKNLTELTKKDFQKWHEERALSEKDLSEVFQTGAERNLRNELFQFESALLSGFAGNIEAFRKAQLQEKDEELTRLYDEAVESGFKGTMKNFEEAMENEKD